METVSIRPHCDERQRRLAATAIERQLKRCAAQYDLRVTSCAWTFYAVGAHCGPHRLSVALEDVKSHATALRPRTTLDERSHDAHGWEVDIWFTEQELHRYLQPDGRSDVDQRLRQVLDPIRYMPLTAPLAFLQRAHPRPG